MKTDSWIGSIVWGRIGGAVLLILAFILQGLGVDFSADDQQQVFGAIQTILASLGGLMVIISKYREKKNENAGTTAQNGQAGFAGITVLFALSMIVLIASTGIMGCAHKTATEQISAQTEDPAAIAKAIYLDSLVAYNGALTSYLPYVELVKESNPAAAIAIYDKFVQADTVLKDFKHWSLVGIPGNMDQESFRALIRDLSIEIAKQIDRGGK